jgi:hypothetical protein
MTSQAPANELLDLSIPRQTALAARADGQH